MTTAAGVRVSLCGRTDLGRTRDHNEDTFLVADLTADRAELTPDVRDHEVGERGSLLLVADGMGGAAAGELASSMASGEILDYLRRIWRADDAPSGARTSGDKEEQQDQPGRGHRAKVHIDSNLRQRRC